jgi:acetate---CoA ligase (ADP-forming)
MDQAAATMALERLIEPRAIALIGASPDATKLAGRPLGYLQRYGYKGKVYGVNPKHQEVQGVRCFADVQSLPDEVDLALILLPATGVADALLACGQRGIPYAISIAGGFAEAGDAAQQERLVQTCAQYGIRLVGPNCVGLLNPRAGVTATFSTELKNRMPRPGSMVLLTQSGALGNSLLQSFNDLDLGLATWVSTGNEADLGVLELVEHFLGDADVRSIVLFVEGLKDGERLLPLARRAHAAGKTIVVLRAGRSQQGRAASISHTGKLAGAWKVWRDISRQGGLVEVQTLDELLDLAVVLDVAGDAATDSAQGLGVLTISGGLGVLISDAAAQSQLPLPAFATSTQAALREILPRQMAVANPVDTALFTDEKGYARCADAVLEDSSIGTLLLILTSLAHDYAALMPWLGQLGTRARLAGKLVAISFLSSSDQLGREQRQQLQAAGVLVLPTAERVVTALGHRLGVLTSRHRLAQDYPGQAIAQVDLRCALKGKGDGIAPHAQAIDGFLSRAQIPQLPERVCTSIDEATQFASASGYPVVLKVVSQDIAHKSEVGGVALGITDAAAMRQAWNEMQRSIAQKAPQATVSGYLVQPMAAEGLELIVGCSVDPELGKVVMVGHGGIYAEAMDDVRFIGLPASKGEIRAALNALRIAPAFQGARGKPVLDLEAAVDVVERLAEAFHRDKDIREVDINPLLVMPAGHGALALDLLVVPEKFEASVERKPD